MTTAPRAAPGSSARWPASCATGTSCESSPSLRRSSDGQDASPQGRRRDRDRRQGARQARQGDADRPEEGLRLRRGPQHDQAPPAPPLGQGRLEGRRGGRDHREGGPDPRVQRDAARQGGQQAHPGQGRARRRQAQAGCRKDREGSRLMEAATEQAKQAAPPPRLRETYESEVKPALTQRFGYSTPMAVPTLEKITLNMGVGEAKQNTQMLEAAIEQLATIAGQRPSVRRAKKSVASFKVREGMPVGVAVTLRRARMWEFLDRLTSIAIPRIRDFRGLNARSFDGRGNYSMGIREQIIFPEIDYDSIDEVRGLDVTITTTAKTDEEAFALLDGLGMPFSQEGRPGQADVEEEEEEERRKEEARERAEAEAAALEQLKEENPEAYEKPVKPEEGEEGEEGAEGEGGEAKADSGDGDSEETSSKEEE